MSLAKAIVFFCCSIFIVILIGIFTNDDVEVEKPSVAEVAAKAESRRKGVAGEPMIVEGSYVGCISEDAHDKLINSNVHKDKDTFTIMILSEQCHILKGWKVKAIGRSGIGVIIVMATSPEGERYKLHAPIEVFGKYHTEYFRGLYED